MGQDGESVPSVPLPPTAPPILDIAAYQTAPPDHFGAGPRPQLLPGENDNMTSAPEPIDKAWRIRIWNVQGEEKQQMATRFCAKQKELRVRIFNPRYGSAADVYSTLPRSPYVVTPTAAFTQTIHSTITKTGNNTAQPIWVTGPGVTGECMLVPVGCYPDASIKNKALIICDVVRDTTTKYAYQCPELERCGPVGKEGDRGTCWFVVRREWSATLPVYAVWYNGPEKTREWNGDGNGFAPPATPIAPPPQAPVAPPANPTGAQRPQFATQPLDPNSPAGAAAAAAMRRNLGDAPPLSDVPKVTGPFFVLPGQYANVNATPSNIFGGNQQQLQIPAPFNIFEQNQQQQQTPAPANIFQQYQQQQQAPAPPQATAPFFIPLAQNTSVDPTPNIFQQNQQQQQQQQQTPAPPIFSFPPPSTGGQTQAQTQQIPTAQPPTQLVKAPRFANVRPAQPLGTKAIFAPVDQNQNSAPQDQQPGTGFARWSTGVDLGATGLGNQQQQQPVNGFGQGLQQPVGGFGQGQQQSVNGYGQQPAASLFTPQPLSQAFNIFGQNAGQAQGQSEYGQQQQPPQAFKAFSQNVGQPQAQTGLSQPQPAASSFTQQPSSAFNAFSQKVGQSQSRPFVFANLGAQNPNHQPIPNDDLEVEDDGNAPAATAQPAAPFGQVFGNQANPSAQAPTNFGGVFGSQANQADQTPKRYGGFANLAEMTAVAQAKGSFGGGFGSQPNQQAQTTGLFGQGFGNQVNPSAQASTPSGRRPAAPFNAPKAPKSMLKKNQNFSNFSHDAEIEGTEPELEDDPDTPIPPIYPGGFGQPSFIGTPAPSALDPAATPAPSIFNFGPPPSNNHNATGNFGQQPGFNNGNNGSFNQQTGFNNGNANFGQAPQGTGFNNGNNVGGFGPPQGSTSSAPFSVHDYGGMEGLEEVPAAGGFQPQFTPVQQPPSTLPPPSFVPPQPPSVRPTTFKPDYPKPAPSPFAQASQDGQTPQPIPNPSTVQQQTPSNTPIVDFVGNLSGTAKQAGAGLNPGRPPRQPLKIGGRPTGRGAGYGARPPGEPFSILEEYEKLKASNGTGKAKQPSGQSSIKPPTGPGFNPFAQPASTPARVPEAPANPQTAAPAPSITKPSCPTVGGVGQSSGQVAPPQIPSGPKNDAFGRPFGQPPPRKTSGPRINPFANIPILGKFGQPSSPQTATAAPAITQPATTSTSGFGQPSNAPGIPSGPVHNPPAGLKAWVTQQTSKYPNRRPSNPQPKQPVVRPTSQTGRPPSAGAVPSGQPRPSTTRPTSSHGKSTASFGQPSSSSGQQVPKSQPSQSQVDNSGSHSNTKPPGGGGMTYATPLSSSGSGNSKATTSLASGQTTLPLPTSSSAPSGFGKSMLEKKRPSTDKSNLVGAGGNPLDDSGDDSDDDKKPKDDRPNGRVPRGKMPKKDELRDPKFRHLVHMYARQIRRVGRDSVLGDYNRYTPRGARIDPFAGPGIGVDGPSTARVLARLSMGGAGSNLTAPPDYYDEELGDSDSVDESADEYTKPEPQKIDGKLPSHDDGLIGTNNSDDDESDGDDSQDPGPDGQAIQVGGFAAKEQSDAEQSNVAQDGTADESAQETGQDKPISQPIEKPHKPRKPRKTSAEIKELRKLSWDENLRRRKASAERKKAKWTEEIAARQAILQQEREAAQKNVAALNARDKQLKAEAEKAAHEKKEAEPARIREAERRKARKLSAERKEEERLAKEKREREKRKHEREIQIKILRQQALENSIKQIMSQPSGEPEAPPSPPRRPGNRFVLTQAPLPQPTNTAQTEEEATDIEDVIEQPEPPQPAQSFFSRMFTQFRTLSGNIVNLPWNPFAFINDVAREYIVPTIRPAPRRQQLPRSTAKTPRVNKSGAITKPGAKRPGENRPRRVNQAPRPLPRTSINPAFRPEVANLSTPRPNALFSPTLARPNATANPPAHRTPGGTGMPGPGPFAVGPDGRFIHSESTCRRRRDDDDDDEENERPKKVSRFNRDQHARFSRIDTPDRLPESGLLDKILAAEHEAKELKAASMLVNTGRELEPKVEEKTQHELKRLGDIRKLKVIPDEVDPFVFGPRRRREVTPKKNDHGADEVTAQVQSLKAPRRNYHEESTLSPSPLKAPPTTPIAPSNSKVPTSHKDVSVFDDHVPNTVPPRHDLYPFYFEATNDAGGKTYTFKDTRVRRRRHKKNSSDTSSSAQHSPNSETTSPSKLKPIVQVVIKKLAPTAKISKLTDEITQTFQPRTPSQTHGKSPRTPPPAPKKPNRVAQIVKSVPIDYGKFEGAALPTPPVTPGPSKRPHSEVTPVTPSRKPARISKPVTPPKTPQPVTPSQTPQKSPRTPPPAPKKPKRVSRPKNVSKIEQAQHVESTESEDEEEQADKPPRRGSRQRTPLKKFENGFITPPSTPAAPVAPKTPVTPKPKFSKTPSRTPPPAPKKVKNPRGRLSSPLSSPTSPKPARPVGRPRRISHIVTRPGYVTPIGRRSPSKRSAFARRLSDKVKEDMEEFMKLEDKY
ncbi:hypothetical protein EJ08DRAFT_644507 [Tothia fuscella]|uniref:Uncharacterized protein n=1 Tax=Tothia fuscella TaxID=1048955 RepID=A0A9P4U4S1_9PEZI|nr:hypothetical protein EJ08DRAFT_644507 [Tothia fuscella]